MYKTIFIASDHGGFEMKRHLTSRLPNLPWNDLGPFDVESVDYPEFADLVCTKLKEHLEDCVGVLICGSGQGMAMRANRYPFIRAALCWNDEIAKLARAHNDANMLCLPGRHLVFPSAERILDVFLNTRFDGGRHKRRVDKLSV